MLSAARTRSKQNGIEFDIDISDINIPDLCPILNIPLVFNKGVVRFNSPVLDRIDNSRGYVKENVAVISHRANSLKNNMDKEIWTAIGNYAKWN